MLSSFQNNCSILFHVSIIEFHSHLSINFGYPSVQKLDLSSISFTSCTMEFRESYPTATKATRILSTLMDCLSWQFHQADVRSKPLVDIRKTPTRNIKEVNVVDVLEITRKKNWPASFQGTAMTPELSETNWVREPFSSSTSSCHKERRTGPYDVGKVFYRNHATSTCRTSRNSQKRFPTS